jgi:hypothetical protein
MQQERQSAIVLVFTCDNCGQMVFFDNDRCLRCRSPLGYLCDDRAIIALSELAPGRLVELSEPPMVWQRCATADVTGCNWLVPAGAYSMCRSCSLTRTRPADDDQEGMGEFVRAEAAKRRLIFQLDELGLPIAPRDEEAGTGLAFDLLSSTDRKVITGHDDGLITLDLAEADDEHREHLRLQLSEPYRTLLGHFRHETGHYYWSVLVDDPLLLDACRNLFGDDTADYAEAVERHYSNDADTASWADSYISRYATMHPYEDWAETFAHYLHILDTLQTARSFGLRSPRTMGTGVPSRLTDATRPDDSRTFGELIDHWLEMSYALNQVNRSMGRDDLYPFVLPPTVIRKLAFMDRMVRRKKRSNERTRSHGDLGIQAPGHQYGQ